MLNKECDQKQSNAKENLISKEISSNQKEQKTQLTYHAISRGYFEKITISKDEISISKDRDYKKIASYSYPESDWQELMALLDEIDIRNLENIEVPSKKFQFDGAAITTFKVNTGKDEYTTPGFDNDNPPKAIEVIVNKLLSIKNSVEKP